MTAIYLPNPDVLERREVQIGFAEHQPPHSDATNPRANPKVDWRVDAFDLMALHMRNSITRMVHQPPAEVNEQ